MRFAVRRATRRLLGLDGEFRAGEDTERARHLSALWGMQWGDLPADSIELEVAAPERHVRLHNLPESKEEPETSEEMAEVLRRHSLLIHHALDGDEVESLVLIILDAGSYFWGSGEFRCVRPTAWPWRIDPPSQWSDNEQPTYVWVDRVASVDDLEAIIASMVTQGYAKGDVYGYIATADLRWIFAPYEGGVDVLAPDSETVVRIRNEYAAWLPAET